MSRRWQCWQFVPVAGGHWMLIDEKDWVPVLRSKWCLHSGGYAEARIAGKIVYAHRLILGLAHGDPRRADHRNGDKLDNRRCNLRIVSAAVNGANRKSVENRGSSRYRGVSRLASGKWRAYCSPKRKQIQVGVFDTEEEAAAAVVAYRAKHMPSERESYHA